MSKTRYLQQIGLSWYVRVKVPAALRHRVGNTHLRRALGTRDFDEADRRKWHALSQIHTYLAGLACTPSKAALGLAAVLGVPPSIAVNCTGTLAPPRGSLEPVAASGSPSTLLLDALLDKWLSSTDVLKTTKFQRRQAYVQLRSFLGADLPPEAISHSVAAAFVDECLKVGADSTSNQRRKMSALAAFWEWLGTRRYLPNGFNPWRGIRLGSNASGRRTPRKRSYTMDELLTLFSKRPSYPCLREVMVLALYTGARIEELCSLTHGSVRWDGNLAFVSIQRSKTEAGSRTFAVAHPIPVDILRARWRKAEPKAAQLFQELRGGGYDNKLSWRVGQAFRYHRNKVGLTGETDFHSFRRTFITLMENLDVDQVRIARYVGHQLPTLAFALYSGGSTETTQKITAQAVHFPGHVERVVRAFLA